jgi:hypothetical protein
VLFKIWGYDNIGLLLASCMKFGANAMMMIAPTDWPQLPWSCP